ncbi:MAG: NAD(P)H-dependent oxidoreductase [Clostridiales bacterium]
MKKIISIIGSSRKKTTYNAVKEFEKSLRKKVEVDFEYLFLDDYNLEFCKGCKLCFNKGLQYCPLDDDRDKIRNKIDSADGVLLATPNYAFHVSARMKNFFDRLTFILHRPEYFNKTLTSIVTQAIFGGNSIRKYMESIGYNMGFYVTKGSCVNTLEPLTDKRQKKIELAMEKMAARFYNGLIKTKPVKPSIFRFIMFRITRSSIKTSNVKLYDYHYYKDNGLFEADYYYTVEIGIVKKVAGKLFDRLGEKIGKNSTSE